MNALTFAQVLNKGYPEFDPQQERAEDGTWAAGGGSGDMRRKSYDRAKLMGLVYKHLPDARAQFLRAIGEHGIAELKVEAPKVEFRLELKPGGDLFASDMEAKDDSRVATVQAAAAISLIRRIAIDSGATAITALAGNESGGYLWPFLGFQLEDEKSISRLTNDVERRLKFFPEKNWYTPEQAAKVRSILEAGGVGMATKLARLSDPISPELGQYMLGTERFTSKPTLGKAMLMGTTHRYRLPREKFTNLERFDTVAKGYPEFDPAQERAADGTWAAGGGVSAERSGKLDVRVMTAEGLHTAIDQRLPDTYVQVTPDGNELTVRLQPKSDFNTRTQFVVGRNRRVLNAWLMEASDTPEGHAFAVKSMLLMRDIAIASGVESITVSAGLAMGGYVWPRLGFELDPKEYTNDLQDYVSHRLGELQALGAITDGEHDDVRALLSNWGPMTPSKIANLNKRLSLTDDQVGNLIGHYNLPLRGKQTLGKLLLAGTSSHYHLPRAKFNALGRLAKSADFVKGNPEFNPDQPRNADGTWGGGGSSGTSSASAQVKVLDAQRGVSTNTRSAAVNALSRIPLSHYKVLVDNGLEIRLVQRLVLNPNAEAAFSLPNVLWLAETAAGRKVTSLETVLTHEIGHALDYYSNGKISEHLLPVLLDEWSQASISMTRGADITSYYTQRYSEDKLGVELMSELYAAVYGPKESGNIYFGQLATQDEVLKTFEKSAAALQTVINGMFSKGYPEYNDAQARNPDAVMEVIVPSGFNLAPMGPQVVGAFLDSDEKEYLLPRDTQLVFVSKRTMGGLPIYKFRVVGSLTKGEPEFNPSQPRAEDGTWSADGGSAAKPEEKPRAAFDVRGQRAVDLERKLKDLLPKGFEVTVDAYSAYSPRTRDISIFKPNPLGLPDVSLSTFKISRRGVMTAEFFTSQPTPEGQAAAIATMNAMYHIAMDSGVQSIKLQAGLQHGGYFWPRVGFELASVEEVRSFVDSALFKLDDLSTYVDIDNKVYDEIHRLLVRGGSTGDKTVATQLARRNDPLPAFNNPEQQQLTPRGRRTVSRYLLTYAGANYSLPRSKFSNLAAFVRGANLSKRYGALTKGNPEFNPDQPRNPDGTWGGDGGDSESLSVLDITQLRTPSPWVEEYFTDHEGEVPPKFMEGEYPALDRLNFSLLGKLSLSDSQVRALAEFDEFTASARLDAPATVFRGVRYYEYELYDSMKPGETVPYPSFIHTSINEANTRRTHAHEQGNFSGLLRIKLPAGVTVGPVYKYQGAENIVLLPRGGTLKYVGRAGRDMVVEYQQSMAKGYPEFDPQQARAEDGTWGGGGLVTRAVKPVSSGVRGAVRHYKGTSRKLNARLRTGADPVGDDVVLVKLLDEFTTAHEVVNKATVYRGFGSDARGVFDTLAIGDVLTDSAYQSTSIDFKVANTFATLFSEELGGVLEIEVPAGTRVGVVGQFWRHHDDERELVLPRNSRLEYLGRSEHDDKVYRFRFLPPVAKGYPEFDPQQERAEDGTWVAGSSTAPIDTSSEAEFSRTLQARFPAPRNGVAVTEYQSGYDVAVGDDDNVFTFFASKEPNRPLTFEQIKTVETAAGREFARKALRTILDAAIASDSSTIRLEAAGAGGYVWPAAGFELDPDGAPNGGDAVKYFLNNKHGVGERIARYRDILGGAGGWFSNPSAERAAFDAIISAGGLDLPAKLAALDTPITVQQMRDISGSNRYLTTGVGPVANPTLGKALLIGVKGNYALPKEKYYMLDRYINRTRKALSFSEALSKYRADQARDERGRFADEGKGRGGGVSSRGKTASRLYARNVAAEGKISYDDFVKSLPSDQQAFISRNEAKLKKLGNWSTETEFRRSNGTWAPQRQRLHESIIREFIEGAIERGAFPDEGDSPTVILMGGRGGAGKTTVVRNELGIDPEHDDNFLYLNSDDIKSKLPEYEGWNAGAVHEESSHISDQIERIARDLGMNIIYDATLKSEDSATRRVEAYEGAGYEIEGVFVHTTPQVSARRAIGRAVRSGRYVNPSYILGSTSNEASFDAVKGRMSKWTLYDGNGTPARKVASGGRK